MLPASCQHFHCSCCQSLQEIDSIPRGFQNRMHIHHYIDLEYTAAQGQGQWMWLGWNCEPCVDVRLEWQWLWAWLKHRHRVWLRSQTSKAKNYWKVWDYALRKSWSCSVHQPPMKKFKTMLLTNRTRLKVLWHWKKTYRKLWTLLGFMLFENGNIRWSGRWRLMSQGLEQAQFQVKAFSSRTYKSHRRIPEAVARQLDQD